MSNPESSWKAFLCLESPLERIWTKGRQAIYIYLAPPLPVKDAMWYFKQCACAPLSLGQPNKWEIAQQIAGQFQHADIEIYVTISTFSQKDSTRLFHFVMHCLLQVTFLRAQQGVMGSSFLEDAVSVVFHRPAIWKWNRNVNFFSKFLFSEYLGLNKYESISSKFFSENLGAIQKRWHVQWCEPHLLVVA